MAKLFSRSNRGRRQQMFCVPLSIAATLGCTVSEAVRAVQRVRGNRLPVEGVHDHEMVAAIRLLGGTVRRRRVLGRPFFGRYVRDHVRDGELRIVRFYRHVTALEGSSLTVDTATHGKVVPVSESPRLRSTVYDVYLVRPPKKASRADLLG